MFLFFFRFCDVEKKEQLVVKREAEAEELTLLSNHSKDRTTTMTMMIPTIPPAESPSSGSLEDITLRDLFFYEAGTLAHSITSDQKFLGIRRFLHCFFYNTLWNHSEKSKTFCVSSAAIIVVSQRIYT